MKIDTQILEDHQARLTVEIETSQLEAAKRKAAQKISQRVKIQGFRPGKAPYPVVLRSVGEATILEEALEILVQDIYPQILDESGIKPYGPGTLEKIEQLDPPKLVFQVPLEATVVLGDYKSIRIPYELRSINEDEVEQAIEDLRDRLAELEPVDRPAQEGDEVFLRISAERKHVEPGQSLTLIRDHSTSVIVKPANADHKREWPFPGFSQYLVGLRVGDEKSIEYTYPDDSPAESLRGTEAIFRFKVEEIKVRKLPELDDEFARSFGNFESIEALRNQVRTHLEQQAKAEYDEAYNEQIIEAILKDSQIKFPPQMLEREIETVINQLESRLKQQNLDMQTYLKTRNITEEELRKELSPIAESRIRRSLVLFEVGRLEQINIEEAELKDETSKTLTTMQQFYNPRELRRMVTDTFIQSMLTNIAADLLTARTLERLQAYAKGEIKTESLSESTAVEGQIAKPRRKKKVVLETKTDVQDTSSGEKTEALGQTKGIETPKPKRKKKTVTDT